MSAFLCSHKHVAAMVAAMVGFNLIRKDESEQVGQLLIKTNLKSLVARYGKSHGFHDHKSDLAYAKTFGGLSTRYHMASNTNATTVSLCDCFDYQACEYDGYYKSKAYKLVKATKDIAALSMARNTDAYEEAPWGL